MGWERPYPNPRCPPTLSGPNAHMAASLTVRITGESGSPGNPLGRCEDQPFQSGLRHVSEGDAGASEGIRVGDKVWQGFLKK